MRNQEGVFSCYHEPMMRSRFRVPSAQSRCGETVHNISTHLFPSQWLIVLRGLERHFDEILAPAAWVLKMKVLVFCLLSHLSFRRRARPVPSYYQFSSFGKHALCFISERSTLCPQQQSIKKTILLRQHTMKTKSETRGMNHRPSLYYYETSCGRQKTQNSTRRLFYAAALRPA